MIWEKKINQIGEFRERVVFCLFPRTFRMFNLFERTYWLETIRVTEVYDGAMDGWTVTKVRLLGEK